MLGVSDVLNTYRLIGLDCMVRVWCSNCCCRMDWYRTIEMSIQRICIHWNWRNLLLLHTSLELVVKGVVKKVRLAVVNQQERKIKNIATKVEETMVAG